MSMRELRQRMAAHVDAADELHKLAESEDRQFTEEEQAQFDAEMASAEELRGRVERGEALEKRQAELGQVDQRRAPAFNKTKLGDSEVRAMAHYFRTGDRGGISHLMREERGVMGLELDIPTARQMTLEQRAVVDSTMNITTAADGANIVPTGFVRDVAVRKNERMLAEQLGVRRIPGKGTTVNYPVEAADPEVLAATDEQSDAHDNPYERDAGNTGLKAFTLAKKTRKIELTEEILEDEDVGLMDYISDRMARQIAATHNAMLVTEVAANGSVLKTFASATAIAAGEPEDIVYNDTLGYYLEEADLNDVAWVMRPTTNGAIASITGDSRLYADNPGNGGERGPRKSILGYPVYWSNKVAATAASAKDVLFGNWDMLGYREAPSLRFIQDPFSVDGLVILKYSFRAVYGVLQAGAVGYGVHPSA